MPKPVQTSFGNTRSATNIFKWVNKGISSVFMAARAKIISGIKIVIPVLFSKPVGRSSENFGTY
jgi:urea transporter